MKTNLYEVAGRFELANTGDLEIALQWFTCNQWTEFASELAEEEEMEIFSKVMYKCTKDAERGLHLLYENKPVEKVWRQLMKALKSVVNHILPTATKNKEVNGYWEDLYTIATAAMVNANFVEDTTFVNGHVLASDEEWAAPNDVMYVDNDGSHQFGEIMGMINPVWHCVVVDEDEEEFDSYLGLDMVCLYGKAV